MCQQQQVELIGDGGVGGRATKSAAATPPSSAEEQLQRKLENMRMSGMPEKAIKTVEKMLKRKENKVQQSDLMKVNKYEEDILAMSTRYTKIVLEMLATYAEDFQGSRTFA